MEATFAEPEIVTRKGKPVSVIIQIKDYEELLERAEAAEDVASLKKARRKPLQYRPLEDYLADRNRKRALLKQRLRGTFSPTPVAMVRPSQRTRSRNQLHMMGVCLL